MVKYQRYIDYYPDGGQWDVTSKKNIRRKERRIQC